MQAQPAWAPGLFENQDLPPIDYLTAPAALALVVERMPEPEIVETLKNIELLLRRGGDGRSGGHFSIVRRRESATQSVAGMTRASVEPLFFAGAR